jgi:hypothetical protein
MCAYLLLVVGASERERKRERQRDRERVKGSKREIESERENKRERERERERKRTREREKNEKIEREGEGGRDALPTLRGQALQQFAQALGDLVEVGHTRVGEGHVDAATTPPALVLGIVRGRRLFLALLVPRHIISCGDLRSLKKKIKSAFVTTCLDTHTQAFRV